MRKTKEVRRAPQGGEEALMRRGLAVVAHDLKAPLCLVRQLALELGTVEAAEERAEIEAELVLATERAMGQLQDLCRLSRAELEQVELEPLSARALCEDIYTELDPLFAYEQRRLELRFGRRTQLALANREMLRSIIYNFCTNALRYSEAESLSQLSVAGVGRCVRITVRDYGPALPKEVWQGLRSGGLTGPTAIATRPDSSGLGLYIASELARRMGAEMGAVRHRDGASLFIDLPSLEQMSWFAR